MNVYTPCTPTHYKSPPKTPTNTQPIEHKICDFRGFYAYFARKSPTRR